MLFRVKSLLPPHSDLDNKSLPRLKHRKKIRQMVPLVTGEKLNPIHALTVS